MVTIVEDLSKEDRCTTAEGELSISGLGAACRSEDAFAHYTPRLKGFLPWKIIFRKMAQSEHMEYYLMPDVDSGFSEIKAVSFSIKLLVGSKTLSERSLTKRDISDTGRGHGEFILAKLVSENSDVLKNVDVVTIQYTVTKYEREHDAYMKGTRPSYAPLFNDTTGDIIFVLLDDEGHEQHVYAHSKILSAASDYYKTMFASGFAEGEEPSSQQIDEAKQDIVDTEPSQLLSRYDGRRKIIRPWNNSYRTYRSMLHYLYTGTVAFAPLASNYERAKQTALVADSDSEFDTITAYNKAHASVLHPMPGVSAQWSCAKEIYELSDELNLKELKAYAERHLKSSLTPENAIDEMMSPFYDRHEEFRDVQMAYIADHWDKVVACPAFKDVISALEDKYTSGAAASVLRLLRLLNKRQ